MDGLAASEDVMTGTLARIITAYREQRPEVYLDLLEMPAADGTTSGFVAQFLGVAHAVMAEG